MITVTPKTQSPIARPIRFEPAKSADPVRGDAPEEPTPSPQVGDKRDFWTWDMSVMPPGQKRVTSTCRATGDHTSIWVDDAVWSRLVTAEDVFTLNGRLEGEAPSGAVDPRRSITETNHEYFGEPPVGMDGDPKVNVLLTEFASFRGTVMDGYFNAFDTLTDKEAQEEYGQRSNESEVIYLNSAARRISSDYMQGVLAHEYQHLLHYPRDNDEENWLSETLGEVAMKVNGYHTDIGHVARHQTRPDRPLVSDTYVDYGACMLFGSYLTEQYGQGFIQELSANPENGVESINSTLSSLGQDTNFGEIYRNWLVANYADSRGVATPGLHYATLDVPQPAEVAIDSGHHRETSSLKPTGARYYRLPAGPLSVNLRSESEGLTAEILEFDGKKMTRKPVDGGEAALGEHPDRILCVGSLAAEELSYSLEVNPAQL